MCDRVCLLSVGLKRYVKKKPPSTMAQQILSLDCLESDLIPIASIKLEPQILKGFF